MKKKRVPMWKPVWWALAVAVLASVVLRFGRAPVARAGVEPAWSDFSHCVLGGPLADGELPSARMRHLILAAMSRGSKDHFDHWPHACRAPAERLRDSLEVAGMKDGALYTALDSPIDALGHPIDQFYAQASWFDSLFAVAEGEGLTRVGTTGTSSPPEPPAQPLTSMPLFTERKLASYDLSVDEVVGPEPLLVFGAPPWPRWCRLTNEDGALSRARCRDVAAAVDPFEPHVRNTSEQGARPIVGEGFGTGASETWDAERGLRLDSAPVHAARVAADGSMVAAHIDDEKRLIVVRKSGDARTVSMIPTGGPVLGVRMVRDYVVWWEGGSAKEPPEIMVARAPADAPVGPKSSLGNLGVRAVYGCVSGDTAVVALRTPTGGAVTFGAGDVWSKPVDVKLPFSHVVCRGDEAWLTGADKVSAPEVFEVHCTRDACTPATVPLSTLHTSVTLDPSEREIAMSRVDAIHVGGGLLVAWDDGYHGGLRMRFARAEALATASDVVLFDHGYLGFEYASAINDVTLAGNGDAAVLLLGTQEGPRALRVDAAGHWAPLVARDE